MTCRDEILMCVEKIIRNTGRNKFSLTDILDCMKQNRTTYPEGTIRTEIVSRLCKNAPVHHATAYSDLERIGHGIYKKVDGESRQRDKLQSNAISHVYVLPAIGKITDNDIQKTDPNEGRSLLIKFGFMHAGSWKLVENKLQLELNDLSNTSPALYTFVKETQVLYIGKTALTLKQRMYQYSHPGPTQKTNIRNNYTLTQELTTTSEIEIMSWSDPDPRIDGEYFLDKAAGYEVALIRKFQPPWNRIM